METAPRQITERRDRLCQETMAHQRTDLLDDGLANSVGDRGPSPCHARRNPVFDPKAGPHLGLRRRTDPRSDGPEPLTFAPWYGRPTCGMNVLGEVCGRQRALRSPRPAISPFLCVVRQPYSVLRPRGSVLVPTPLFFVCCLRHKDTTRSTAEPCAADTLLRCVTIAREVT